MSQREARKLPLNRCSAAYNVCALPLDVHTGFGKGTRKLPKKTVVLADFIWNQMQIYYKHCINNDRQHKDQKDYKSSAGIS